MNIRIGYGIDFHQLIQDRPFWLGGIEIPYHKGALGHSDADVLLHAICDAILGAMAAGDIGTHFPDNDAQYKNIDSKILLAKCIEILHHQSYKLSNIDATICLQAPKISPYVLQMRQCIAQIVGLNIDAVSIKATTTEKMGFVGREEGITAHASVLIYSQNA